MAVKHSIVKSVRDRKILGYRQRLENCRPQFGTTGRMAPRRRSDLVSVFYADDRASPDPSVYLWGIRLGLLLLVLGSAEGMGMLLYCAHTVSLSDGGLGLPVVNRSLEAGDLRVAHLLGLHAAQIPPLAGLPSITGSRESRQRPRWLSCSPPLPSIPSPPSRAFCVAKFGLRV
jgi:hypothetical protein